MSESVLVFSHIAWEPLFFYVHTFGEQFKEQFIEVIAQRHLTICWTKVSGIVYNVLFTINATSRGNLASHN